MCIVDIINNIKNINIGWFMLDSVLIYNLFESIYSAKSLWIIIVTSFQIRKDCQKIANISDSHKI